MLPCQDCCPDYHVGCHKICRRWNDLQEEQRVVRQRKKRYLKFYTELCGQTIRQLRSMQARYPAR